MSKLIVEVTRIDSIEVHPNADSLELATVKGWNCVVRKGCYKAGDKCLYIPIDAVLPQELEAKLFSNSKVKLSGGRIKTIRLRGAISQGLIVDLDTVGLTDMPEGTDVADRLGITKYEPQIKVSNYQFSMTKKIDKHPLFREYTCIEHGKNYPNLFTEGEVVYVREKLHGTNYRAHMAPLNANTIFKKILRYMGLIPQYELVYGSHHCQISEPNGNDRIDVYSEVTRKYNIGDRLRPNEAIYGEIIGDNIQRGFTYGCAKGERQLVIFDVSIDGAYLDELDLSRFCRDRGFQMAPLIYCGAFHRKLIEEWSNGPSLFHDSQKFREGCVIRPIKERNGAIGRVILKFIGDEYYMSRHEGDDSCVEFAH